MLLPARGFALGQRFPLPILKFQSLRDHLLELALNVRVAHMLIFQQAIGIDTESGGNRS